MIGDRERRYCDSGGLGILYEIDPAQFRGSTNIEGLRNIANDPKYIKQRNEAMYEACKKMRERRYTNALSLIKQQPFYT